MGESTTQTPPDKLPRYIPEKDKLCLSKEQAEHVYEAVENGEQVKPLSVNSSIDEQDLREYAHYVHIMYILCD